MKIAICLSGHTRTYTSTVKTHLDNFVNKGDLEIDFFIHTYNTTGIKPKEGDNTSNESVLLSMDELKNVLNIYNPKYILIEDNKEVVKNSHPERWNSRQRVMPETNVSAVLSMFYSIKKSIELKSFYEKENNFIYDVVIRLRFDDLITKQDFDFSNVKEGFVYVPTIDGLNYNAKDNQDQIGWTWRGGLNDQLSFGTSRTMDIYGGVYDNIEKMYSNGVWFHPETFLKNHTIINNGLKPYLVDEIEFKLYR